jgi:hypothetical protein
VAVAGVLIQVGPERVQLAGTRSLPAPVGELLPGSGAGVALHGVQAPAQVPGDLAEPASLVQQLVHDCVVPSEGIAAVAALGTDWLAVRIDQLPPGIQTAGDLPPGWLSFARDGWHILSPVQDRLPPGDIGPMLRNLAAAALAHAAALAAK